MKITNQRRSSFGPHFAGTGIAQQTSEQFDDEKVERGIRVFKPGMLPSDKYMGDKETFQAYCKAMSGDVEVYNLKDKGETPE